MSSAEGAVKRASDRLASAEYHGEFRFDTKLLEVTYTDPAAGSDLILVELTAPTTAVLSMAGMDGGNGAWPVLYGTDPVSADGLRVVVDEDTLLDTERSHTTEQLALMAFDGTSSGGVAPYLRTGVVSGVTNSGWTEVILDRDYGTGMVVVATANYSASDPPLVVRVKDAENYQFSVMAQRADGSSAAVSGIDVHYVVMQERCVSQHGSGPVRIDGDRRSRFLGRRESDLPEYVHQPRCGWTGDERHRRRGILCILGPGR